MSDMTEIFREMIVNRKMAKGSKAKKYEPEFIEIGAVKKAAAVWQFEDWFLYPTKGFAMNRYNTDWRMSIPEFLNKVKQERKETND